MNPAGPQARRFPLIARPRPACPALSTRVGDLVHRAEVAERDHDLGAAAAVHNLAALLASDLGLPDLARAWCHRHAGIYLAAGRLDPAIGRYAIEPLVNLARLQIRAGAGAAAFSLIDRLYQAVRHRLDTRIDGIILPAASLRDDAACYSELLQWIWAVRIADGSRALASVGRWHDAHTALVRANGIGKLLLDGRQIAILAAATVGDLDTAHMLIDTTVPGEPWQYAVRCSLRLLCRRTATASRTDIDLAYETYGSLPPQASLVVFHTRLGLSIIDAVDNVASKIRQQLIDALAEQVIGVGDAYAAREMVQHRQCAASMPADRLSALNAQVAVSGLGAPDRLLEHQQTIDDALTRSGAVLTELLRSGAVV